MGQLAVFKQMTLSPSGLFNVLLQEIGVKSNCLPFAVKAIDALNSLGSLTETEATKAANVFLDNLQTLNQGGITAEDYDKIDMIKRGKIITLSARVEAFYRAAARKGYRITDTIIAVPKADGDTTYFEEDYKPNGDRFYRLRDKRVQGDRKITTDRLVSGYFSKVICRIEIVGITSNMRLEIECEMSIDEILSAAAASDNGIFKSKWEAYTKDNGYQGKRRVLTKELNIGSIWNVWTGEMVKKTIIRRALKRVREVLPELKETIYAFDHEPETQETAPAPAAVEIPLQVVNVDLDKLTGEQIADVREMRALFTANPKLAADKTTEIMAMFNGSNVQEVINLHYASLKNLTRSKANRGKLAPLFDSLVEKGAAS